MKTGSFSLEDDQAVHSEETLRLWHASGAPNENIVQNNLNIALLNAFWYLNGRNRHIFIP